LRPPGWIAQPVDVADGQPVAAEQLLDHGAGVPGEHVGHLRREPHLEAEVGDVPGHVVGGGHVGAGDHVDDLERRPGPGPGLEHDAAAASLNSACATICSRSCDVGSGLRALSVLGCTCRLVSSRHSITAGRCRAVT
jgi:hypothetical protein